jgi:hypothetical protein
MVLAAPAREAKSFPDWRTVIKTADGRRVFLRVGFTVEILRRLLEEMRAAGDPVIEMTLFERTEKEAKGRDFPAIRFRGVDGEHDGRTWGAIMPRAIGDGTIWPEAIEREGGDAIRGADEDGSGGGSGGKDHLKAGDGAGSDLEKPA